jgi:ribosomal-protein-alanine N-acetyltransferase
MPSAIRIRSLLLNDASALATLHHDSFPKSWSEDAFISLLNAATTSGLLAATEQTPVGFILAQVFMDEVEVLTFAVTPSHQGQGVGTQLLSTLLDKLKAQGIKNLFLDVSVLNTAARALYEKYGFQPIAKRINYFPHLTDATALVLKCAL